MNKIFGDISDFLYLRKIIRNSKKKKVWLDLNLRHDWFYNPYTVVNLPPEAYAADREAQLQYVAYFIQDVNLYFVELLLQDMLIPFVEPIEGTASYLVVYHADYEILSGWWFTKKILLLTLGTYIWMKYDVALLLHKIYEQAINNLIH